MPVLYVFGLEKVQNGFYIDLYQYVIFVTWVPFGLYPFYKAFVYWRVKKYVLSIVAIFFGFLLPFVSGMLFVFLLEILALDKKNKKDTLS